MFLGWYQGNKKPPFANLRAEMLKNGHTQKDLRELLGISHTAMSKKLCGQTEFTKSEIDKLLNFYNKSYEELFK